jgi:hypothetical protein
MKLVAGAGETAKAHALKAMLDLQVRKNASLPSCAHCSIARTAACPLVTGHGCAHLH